MLQKLKLFFSFIFPILAFIGLFLPAVILVSMVNSDIIHGTTFAILQVVLGIILSSIFIFIKIKIENLFKNDYLDFSSSSTEKYNKSVVILTSGVIICMVLSIFSLLRINENYNLGIKGKETYMIESKGIQLIKFTQQQHYLMLVNKNSNEKRKHYVSDKTKYSINDEIHFNIRKGFFGFDYIEVDKIVKHIPTTKSSFLLLEDQLEMGDSLYIEYLKLSENE